MQKKIETISGSLLFKGLSDAQLRQVAEISLLKEYNRGETIFFDGDEATGFYMVVSGKVKIFKMSLEGKEQILHIFGPGEPFGEVPVFHGNPFPANAVPMVRSSLLFFPRQKFVDLISRTPSLSLSMLSILSLRLRQFTAQVESLSLKEVPARLAAHLIYLAGEQKRTDRVILDIPKGQLANLLGTTPETLSRIFARMTEEGVIQVEGKTIELLDYEELLRR